MYVAGTIQTVREVICLSKVAEPCLLPAERPFTGCAWRVCQLPLMGSEDLCQSNGMILWILLLISYPTSAYSSMTKTHKGMAVIVGPTEAVQKRE